MDYEASIEIDDDVVKEYVKDNFGIDDIFDDNDVKAYIGRNFMPEDCFDEASLTTWAVDHGFVKQE